MVKSFNAQFRKSVSSLLKISDKKNIRSTNSSLIRDITTPDKFIPIQQKNSSSNKKSTIKSFRPHNGSMRRTHQIGMRDSSQNKVDSKYKMPLKLDFTTKAISKLRLLKFKDFT